MRAHRHEPVGLYGPGRTETPLNLAPMKLIDAQFMENAVLRQPPDGKAFAQPGLLRRAQTRPAADGQDGPARRLPAPAHHRASPGAPQVSLSAQELGDRAPEPGLVRRHYLHSHAARLSLSGRDHGLGDTPGAGMAAVEHRAMGRHRSEDHGERTSSFVSKHWKMLFGGTEGRRYSTRTRAANSPARGSRRSCWMRR